MRLRRGPGRGRAENPRERARILIGMTAAQLISFARGAPSLDIIDIDGLKRAASRAFEVDPAAATGYGPAHGYLPLRGRLGIRPGETT